VAVRGPALTFDPRYVDFVISAWHPRSFVALSTEELEHLATAQAEQVFTELAMIGLAEEHAKLAAIRSAITLLKALKFVKQTNSGTGAGRIARLAATQVGRAVLAEEPAAGHIRVGLVGRLIESSPPLATLLYLLEGHGPIARPVAHPLPGTPRKGAAFNRAVLEGLATYGGPSALPTQGSKGPAARQTPLQQLKGMAAQATQRHPASGLPSFEKVLSLAVGLGLVWRDVDQINQALGIECIGPAVITRDGSLKPHVPAWRDIQTRFQDALLRVYQQRVDSSGFVTIEGLRGGIGRELRLSALVVDAFLDLAREAGDRGAWPFTLQFEPDDELLYAADRRPLIWHGAAFDFVEIRRIADAAPARSTSSTPRHTGGSSSP